jgi:hypothetical protein
LHRVVGDRQTPATGLWRSAEEIDTEQLSSNALRV